MVPAILKNEMFQLNINTIKLLYILLHIDSQTNQTLYNAKLIKKYYIIN